VNGHFTDWFDVNSGLKQRCPLSPILFNLYINDLVTFLKSFDCGIELDGGKVCILLYADDVVILANNENEMQIILNALSMWCTENCTSTNTSKGKVVHFRSQSIPKSEFVFTCGDDCIQYCSDYKYLGLVLNEFLDYNITAKSVALSANRALGLVIAKCKILGGVSHGVFTKLYDSMVSSIVEYGASIWGTRNYSCINAIQNRAYRVLTKMFFVHVSTCKWRDSLNADISRSGRGGINYVHIDYLKIDLRRKIIVKSLSLLLHTKFRSGVANV
jgi:hypothetical protein